MGFAYRTGNELSDDLYDLTLNTGLMQYWLENEREMMHAIVYEKDGVYYGWCAYVFIGPNMVKIGTFVADDARGTGLGRKLLNMALTKLASTHKGCTVRYGGSKFAKFDRIYKDEIVKAKLNPDKYYGLYRD